MSFSLDLTRLIAKSKASLDETVTRFVFGMFARIIMRSPVDTGRFRGNWVISFDDAASMTVERDDRGVVTQNGSGNSKVKDEVLATLSSTNWIGRKAYLVNNLPYGKYLEYGTPEGRGPISQQAPYGMVRLTVNEYAEVLDQAKPYKL